MLYRENENTIDVIENNLPWSFDAGAAATEPFPIELPKNRHFFMSAKLDNTRLNRDVQRLMEEVISHLSLLDGSQLDVSLEVNVMVKDSVPPQIVRTVSENCRTLKVQDFGFDE